MAAHRTVAAVATDLDVSSQGDVWTSRTIRRNGLSPAWMETVEVGTSDPEMAVLRLSVWDRPGGGAAERFLCYATMPACALRGGYRIVHMRDADGCKIAFCKLQQVLTCGRRTRTFDPYALLH